MDSPANSGEGLRKPAPIKIRPKGGALVDLEAEFAVSPGTPLLSTDIEENGWACGCNKFGQLGIGNAAEVIEPQALQVVKRWAAFDFGERHSAGISCDGLLYLWGQNSKGQLGQEDEADRDQPTKVNNIKDVRSISCGREHTVIITGRDCYACGSNSHGQLGIDKEEHFLKRPTAIKQLKNVLVSQVVCGAHHTLIVSAQSAVWAWGRNDYGQLGLGDTVDRRTPTVIDALWALPVRQIAAGDAHSAALTHNGFLFTWGDNGQGQLGQPPNAEAAAQSSRKHSSGKHRRSRKKVSQKFLQAMLEMGISREYAELALIETQNMGVEFATEWLFSNPDHVIENRLEEVGENSARQDEAATDCRVVPTPKRVALTSVRFVAAAGSHTVVVNAEGVFSWGANESGQLGLGDIAPKQLPNQIDFLTGKHIEYVACGSSHTLFQSSDGFVYGCGESKHGQLGVLPRQSRLSSSNGNGSTSLETSPVPVQLPFMGVMKGKGGEPVVQQVVAGGHGSAFLTRSPHEFSSLQQIDLWQKLQTAIQNAQCDEQAENGSVSPQSLALAQAIEMVFGSAAALCTCFCKTNGFTLDYVLLNQVQTQILSIYKDNKGSENTNRSEKHSKQNTCQSKVAYAMTKALSTLLEDLYTHVKSLGVSERAQLLLAAAQHPQFADQSVAKQLLPKLCTTILNAPSVARALLVNWWGEYPGPLLETRVVKPLQSYLTQELMQNKKLTVNVMNAIKVLSRVVDSNQHNMRLESEAFYNSLISDKMDVLDHYVAWRQTCDQPERRHNSEGPFSFCSYPFLLDAKAKQRLLLTEARIQMEQTVAQARMEQMLSGNRKRDEHAIVQQPRIKTRIDEGSSSGKDKKSGGSRSYRERSKSDKKSLQNLLTFGRNLFGKGKDDGSAEPGESSKRRNAREGSSAMTPERQNSMNLPTPEKCEVTPQHPDMCILRVRRTHLVKDALSELARQYEKDLWKPLRVHFIGEEGIDAGGVKKEFFQLLMQELLNPDYGLLSFQPEQNTYWFADTMIGGNPDDLYLVGLLIGLAIYNGVILDCPLPLALYKKLLHNHDSQSHAAPGLRDLELMQPTLAKSLRQILDYDAPEPLQDVIYQDMTINIELYGKILNVPLKEGGVDSPVTEYNRREYVDLYIDYILNKSIEKHFVAFSNGFMKLFHGPAISLFNAQELEHLVCGTPTLDFAALERNAKYEGGWNKENKAVIWLWGIVKEMKLEEQRCFLKFFTGSDRAPIGGLGNMKCIVQRDGPDSWKLPTSHTCFNTLLLPEYESKQKMMDRLKLAILNAEGFGLE